MVKVRIIRCPTSLLFDFSYVDVTGIDITQDMEVDNILDPFSKTRLGNDSNPFVTGAVNVREPVPDDSADIHVQEFNEVKSVFNPLHSNGISTVLRVHQFFQQLIKN